MGLTESLYDYVLQSGNPALQPDRLYRCARVWGRCFWGKQYPDQQVSDDMENYRALELLHVGMSLRYRTWQLLVDNVPDPDHRTESLFNEIMAATDVCLDALLSDFFSTNECRNIQICSLRLNSRDRPRCDAPLIQLIWPLAPSMHKLSFTAVYCAPLAPPERSIGML
jgi:hypothetical protein